MTARRLRVLLPIAVLAVAVLVVVSARDPEPDLDPPVRAEGQVVADLAGVLGDEVQAELQDLADAGWDVVALTYETEQANQGEAQRGGLRLLEAWDADVVLVAVARPGHFQRTDAERRRFFGVAVPDAFVIPGSLREEVTEQVIPPYAADNEWPEGFVAAAEALAEGLEDTER